MATAVLDEPLVVGAPRRDGWNDPAAPRRDGAQAAGAPRVDSFEARPAASLAGGQELDFTARGTPGAQASVNLPGARRFFLHETQPGVYSGSYTIRSGDRIERDAPVTLRLVTGDAAATRTLDRPLVASSAPAPRRAPRRRRCADCATVVAVNPIEVKGAGSYVGPVAGGVLGAILGSQVGGGTGRTVARRRRRRRRRARRARDRAPREQGRRTTRSSPACRAAASRPSAYESDPGLPVGTRVRVVDGRLVRDR